MTTQVRGSCERVPHHGGKCHNEVKWRCASRDGNALVCGSHLDAAASELALGGAPVLVTPRRK